MTRRTFSRIRQVAVALVLGCGPVVPLHAQEPGIQDSTIRLNGIDLYFRFGGKGDPVVLLHGFGLTGAQWRPAFLELARTNRVIVPDLRGHGHSTNPANVFTHRQAALDIYALLDTLGIRRFKAMGTSSGGMVLIHMATQQPSRVEALVLIGATSYFSEQARKLMAEATVESITPEQWALRRQVHVRGDEQIRALQEQFRAFKDNYDDMNFTPARLATIAARTLIIQGDRDQGIPIEIAAEMYHAIPGAALFVVPNGRHGLLQNSPVPILPTALAFLAQRP